MSVLWSGEGDDAVDDVRAAAEHDQNAEDAGQEARAVDEQAEREEPEALEDFDDVEAATVQGEEEHGEGFAMRLI